MKLAIKSDFLKYVLSWGILMFIGIMSIKIMRSVCSDAITFVLFFPAWVYIIKPIMTEIDNFLDS